VPPADLTALTTPIAAAAAGGIGVLVTGLLLGFRHGFDWDHIAAITDITSTSAAADVATGIHEADHVVHPHPHGHAHGGPDCWRCDHQAAAVVVLPTIGGRPRVEEERH
jgi:hypothetical protein